MYFFISLLISFQTMILLLMYVKKLGSSHKKVFWQNKNIILENLISQMT